MSQHNTDPAGATVYGTEPELDEGDGSTADQVKGQVRDKAQEAQAKAKGALGQARGRFSEQVDQRSTQAGERISQQAADVRGMAEQLRNQGKDGPAGLAEQVASQADRMGDYLKGASGDRILQDVEDFARRQPMLVAAGALALGFAASRFLKASSSRRYASGSRSDGAWGYDRADAIPATGTPVVGTYGPAPTEPLGDPLGDPLGERRS